MKRWRLAWLPVVVLLAVALMVALIPRRSALLSHARRISDTHGWQYGRWIDDRHLIVFQEAPPKRLAAWILDTRTGTKLTFDSLNRVLAAYSGHMRIEVSPNGEWVVLVPWETLKSTHVLASIQSGSASLAKDVGPFIAWLPDSSGWLTLGKGKNYRQLQIITTHLVRRHAFPPPANGSMDLGFTPAGTFVTANWVPYQTTDVSLTEYDLGNGTMVHKKSIRVPAGFDLSNIALSRDGTRLVWQMRDGIPRGAMAVIHSWLDWLRQEPDTDTVWVSDVHGRDMRQVGSVEVKRGYDYDSDLSVEWMPDNRHLSVVYRDTLYVVPAP